MEQVRYKTPKCASLDGSGSGEPCSIVGMTEYAADPYGLALDPDAPEDLKQTFRVRPAEWGRGTSGAKRSRRLARIEPTMHRVARTAKSVDFTAHLAATYDRIFP